MFSEPAKHEPAQPGGGPKFYEMEDKLMAMNREEGTFEPVNPEKVKEIQESVDNSTQSLAQALKKLGDETGKPILYIGEIIEIKGVKFKVQRIRAIGVLVLRMVPDQK